MTNKTVMQFADSVFVAKNQPGVGYKVTSIYPRQALTSYSPSLETLLDSGYTGNDIAVCCWFSL